MKKYTNTTAGGISLMTIIVIIISLIWMAVTLLVGKLGYYEYTREADHALVIMTVLLPTIVYFLAFATLKSVRDWTTTLDLAILTLPHAWRTVGFTFLTLWFYDFLPGGFASPAGFGDFGIAIAAPFVAVALWFNYRGAVKSAVLFHCLGLLDLVVALYTGVNGFGIKPENMHLIDPMTQFPLVIIPTVFVPLLILSHIMVFTKLLLIKNREVAKDKPDYSQTSNEQYCP